jgi:hypothetical protein
MRYRPVRLLIVRGLPGAGKSYYASRRRGYRHYESDQFWVGADGVYRFDGARLGEAHAWCLDSVTEALVGGRSVVVSNTFTTSREILPYIYAAEEACAAVSVVHVVGEFGSVHGVPAETLAAMAARWERWEGERVYRPRLSLNKRS